MQKPSFHQLLILFLEERRLQNIVLNLIKYAFHCLLANPYISFNAITKLTPQKFTKGYFWNENINSLCITLNLLVWTKHCKTKTGVEHYVIIFPSQLNFAISLIPINLNCQYFNTVPKGWKVARLKSLVKEKTKQQPCDRSPVI